MMVTQIDFFYAGMKSTETVWVELALRERYRSLLGRDYNLEYHMYGFFSLCARKFMIL